MVGKLTCFLFTVFSAGWTVAPGPSVDLCSHALAAGQGQFCGLQRDWEGPGGVKEPGLWGQDDCSYPGGTRRSLVYFLSHWPRQQPLGWLLAGTSPQVLLPLWSQTTYTQEQLKGIIEYDRKPNLCILIFPLLRDQTCKVKCDNSCL